MDDLLEAVRLFLRSKERLSESLSRTDEVTSLRAAELSVADAESRLIEAYRAAECDREKSRLSLSMATG